MQSATDMLQLLDLIFGFKYVFLFKFLIASTVFKVALLQKLCKTLIQLLTFWTMSHVTTISKILAVSPNARDCAHIFFDAKYTLGKKCIDFTLTPYFNFQLNFMIKSGRKKPQWVMRIFLQVIFNKTKLLFLIELSCFPILQVNKKK